MSSHSQELEQGQRFGFGKNWSAFLSVVDDDRIVTAEQSLQTLLGIERLDGMTFLDVGSGSGLFSLAACRLGARVMSFDYDPDSVAATRALKQKFGIADKAWRIEEGSALDLEYLKGLGRFDIVYSWGVLHHTGKMWEAMANVTQAVAPGGRLAIAIYNDQGRISDFWTRVKRLYCSGAVGRYLVCAVFIPFFVMSGLLSDLIRLRNPASRYTSYRKQRGMSRVHDWLDWLGGYPFEVATPEKVVEFYKRHGFETRMIIRRNGLGCNEFSFASERDEASNL